MSRYRECDVCGRELADDNPGRICFICSDKIRHDMLIRDDLHYTVKDLRVLLGYGCDESIRRLGRKNRIPGKVGGPRSRHRYSKKVIDYWIASEGKLPPALIVPTSPLQEQAYALCSKGDHGWFEDERFAGHAYEIENFSHSQTAYVVTVGQRKKCYFCGYVGA